MNYAISVLQHDGVVSFSNKRSNSQHVSSINDYYYYYTYNLLTLYSGLPDPDQVLRPPRKLQYRPDQDLRRRISIYFQQVLGGRHTEFATQLPEVMPLWGKMRIHGGMRYAPHLQFNGYDKSPGTILSCK